MELLERLLAKFGPQKAKNIPPITKKYEFASFQWSHSPLFGALDFTRRQQYLLATTRAVEMVRQMERAGVGSPCGHLRCNDAFYAEVIETLMFIDGYLVEVQDVRGLLKQQSAMRRDIRRAFNPWWSRRPWWWPFSW